MRRRIARSLVGLAMVVLAAAACESPQESASPTSVATPLPTTAPESAPSSSPASAEPSAVAGRQVVVTFLVAGSERYRVRLTQPDDIAIAEQLLAGQPAPAIPNGRLIRGVTDVNVGHDWSIDPADIEFADSTTEVCDGLPSHIDSGEFAVDRYCPWAAKVVAVEPLP